MSLCPYARDGYCPRGCKGIVCEHLTPKPESEYLTDPREIRKKLREVAYRSTRIDGPAESGPWHQASFLVRTNLRMSDATGMSGEDAMTILAYTALLAYEKATDQLLANLNNEAMRPIIMVRPKEG